MTAAEAEVIAAAEDDLHAALVKLLDYETVRGLQIMRGGDGLRRPSEGEAMGRPADSRRSIPQAAEILKVPTKSLTRTMQNLDGAYFGLTGVHLIENLGGRLGYRLTESGADFAVDAGEIVNALVALVHDLSGSKGRLIVPTTKAGLAFLKRLNDQLLASAAHVWLDPELHRTATIHRPSERETAGPYAFYSIGRQEMDQPYHEGQYLHLENGANMIVYKAERFGLLAPDVLAEELNQPSGWRGPVSIAPMLRTGWTLLVPNGGAVYDFLDHNTQSWARLGRPPKDILDLQAGLMCLKLGIYQRRMDRTGGAVMVVHQSEDELHESDQLPAGYRVYSIKEEKPCWALTGLFQDPHQMSRITGAQRARWALVWKIAKGQCTGQQRQLRISA